MSYALNSLYKGMPKHRQSRCSSGPLNEHRSLLLLAIGRIKDGVQPGLHIVVLGQVLRKVRIVGPSVPAFSGKRIENLFCLHPVSFHS